MDPVAMVVLVAAVAASIWLLYYVRFYLPHQLDERFTDSMKAFSTAVELRFPSHVGLTDRVVEVSELLALKLGLSASSRRDLLMAARLRDIGLCAIPYRLNGRAPADWTEAERSTYDRHPEVSGAMLDLVPSLQHLAEIVRAHHADFDAGAKLPLEARVLRVATDYAWLHHNCGEALANQSIVARRGSAYCPQVVDAFSAVLTSSRAEYPQPTLA